MRPAWTFVALALLSTAHAQPSGGVFERLHSGDGLSHNSVYAIHQDHEGFMWFGTLDGLNRYDGYAFVVYRHDPADTTSLSHNLVRVIHEDADGTLWVGTQEGVNRKAFGAETFERYPVPSHPESGDRSVYHLVRDGSGTLWAAAAAGLLRYDPDRDRFEPVIETMDAHTMHLEPRPDGLWVLLSGGVDRSGTFVRLNPGTREVVEEWHLPLAWGSLHRFAFDTEGQVWFNHLGPAVASGDRLVPSREAVHDNAHALHVGPQGEVLVGSSGGGLYMCHATADCMLEWIDDTRHTWLHNFTRSLYEDRTGALWVGTYGGVYRADPHRKPFVVYRHDPADPSARGKDAVSAIARTPDGTLWVGTFGGELSRLESETGRLVRVRAPGAPEGLIWDLHLDGTGRLWVGAGGGLYHYDASARRFVRHRSMLESGLPATVTAIEERAGQLWVGTFSGLSRYDPATGALTGFPVTGDARGLSQIAVTVLRRDRDVLWIGLHGGEVNRLDLRTERFEHLLPESALGAPQTSEATYDLALGRDSVLWIASGAGLFRYDRRTEAYAQFTTQHGLPGSVVYAVQPDPAGHLWLGTNRGLARLDPATGAIRTYDLSDGIGTMEFNRHARLLDADGSIFLGGGEGLLYFNPEAIRDDPTTPPVVLTAVESASRSGTTAYNPRGLAQLTLPPGETTVTFTFAALGFTDPARNRYRYRLDGFDDDWVEAGTQRQARYTNVPPGHYTLRVLAANRDGVWSEAGLTLPVIVEPAFWQTVWFRLLVVLALVGAGMAVYRARVNRLLALERLRLRIAGDLHDDLSSDLSGIALATDLLRQRPHTDERDRVRLTEIRDSALGMVESLRDIVWTINPEHDTLEALVRRMRLVARQLLAEHEHTFTTELPDDAAAVPMPLRRDLLLLMKEALHNVIRHAAATHVAVRLARSDDRLVLTVADDGRGFDVHANGTGHGLGSMRARAERMGGALHIESRPGEGTTLTVRVDLARTRDGSGRRRAVS